MVSNGEVMGPPFLVYFPRALVCGIPSGSALGDVVFPMRVPVVFGSSRQIARDVYVFALCREFGDLPNVFLYVLVVMVRQAGGVNV